jgi:hypothetical protein
MRHSPDTKVEAAAANTPALVSAPTMGFARGALPSYALMVASAAELLRNQQWIEKA